jgi:hypothetical protein
MSQKPITIRLQDLIDALGYDDISQINLFLDRTAGTSAYQHDQRPHYEVPQGQRLVTLRDAEALERVRAALRTLK